MSLNTNNEDEMKKIVLTTLLFFGLNAHAGDITPRIIDSVSDSLVKDHLFLASDGDLQPTTDTDGTIVNYVFKDVCNGSKERCTGMLMSVSNKGYDDCLRPSMSYRFDELPVTLSNNRIGIFTVPTITDKEAQNRDYFVFWNQGVCHEVSWGFAGSQYDRAVELANELIGQGL